MINLPESCDESTCKNTMAYNMKVIQAIWKYEKKEFGPMKIKGNEQNTDSFYGTFEKSRQTIREIVNNEGIYNIKLVMKWAERIEKKTGIPADILSGEKRICLSKRFDRNCFEQYQDYIDCCEWLNEQCEKSKEKPVSYSKEKIKKLIADKGNEKQKIQFKEIINTAEWALAEIKQFDNRLAEEIKRLEKRNGYSDYDDLGTYKIFYFIKYGKPYNAACIVTLDNIIEVLEATRTRQLKELGQQGLKEYIEALRQQLKLAEAVYMVAVDCGDFEKDSK